MSAARPLITVVRTSESEDKLAQIVLPPVFLAPIRPDIVQFVHLCMAKNSRQARAVNVGAGHQHSAESWGTGRAVSRIPRVSGGGTSRAGQGAFGNMCRSGRMFAPTKIWRRWHRKINTNQRRYAIASALAASALPALVMARGHRISQIAEIPLVVDNSVESTIKTKKAIETLKAIGAWDDVVKARDSRQLRRGKGKARNRRHVMRRGPLIIYNEDHGITKSFRNLPGVDLVQVERLNLLTLAPGGHLGRLIIWTQSAFERLNELWGSVKRESTSMKGYILPRGCVTNTDITRIINSDEIQAKCNPAKTQVIRAQHTKNPLKNFGARVKLNPYAMVLRRTELLTQERRAAQKTKNVKAARAKAAHKSNKMTNFKRIAQIQKVNVTFRN